MKIRRTKQCDKCPWRKDVNPNDIPNGYSKEKHEALACTIAIPSDLNSINDKEIHIMACHETHNTHCVGWLVHQLGVGNNISLRLAMLDFKGVLKTIGPQHQTFVDTLPKDK